MKFLGKLSFATAMVGIVAAASVGTTSPAWSQNSWNQAASVTFAIQIESVTTPTTLALPDGTATSAPISTGILAVSSKQGVLFHTGTLAGESGLQQLAEDGNPVPIINKVARTRIKHVEFVAPNLHYRVTATPGDRLHFAVMFVQSNDLFYAFDEGGLPLFDAQGQPVSGDVTQYVSLWDAGTEVNQAPGVGSYQAPRQVQPGAGQKEFEPIELVSQVGDGYTYPPVANVIKVVITPVTE